MVLNEGLVFRDCLSADGVGNNLGRAAVERPSVIVDIEGVISPAGHREESRLTAALGSRDKVEDGLRLGRNGGHTTSGARSEFASVLLFRIRWPWRSMMPNS